MPDIADVAWSERDDHNTEAVPYGWPTGAFPAYTDLVGQMMMGATKRFWNKINPVYQTTGTGDVYVVQTEVGFDQINLYELLCVRIDRSNIGGTPTLQWGNTSPRTIVKAGASGYVPLTAGDLFGGNSHTFWYNGAFYVLTDPATPFGGPFQPLSANLTTWAAIARPGAFDTWVANPSSANFLALLTTKTGTGSSVFNTNAVMSGTFTLGQDPASAFEAATKQYVDNVAAGLDIKPSARLATTANITLSAPQIIDGMSAIAGDRVVVKNQATPSQNGIYVVAAGAWTRATDMDTWAEVPGANVWVEEGTANADTAWVCTSNAGGTIGTTAITWTQFGGSGAYQAASANLTSWAAITRAAAVDTFASTGVLPLANLALGTSGYALIGNGASASSYQGFLQAGTGAVTRTWQDRGRDILNAADFGVSTAASASANRAAFQAAITAAQVLGCDLKINYGTYSIDAALDISGCSNVWINGSGIGTVISTTSATAQIFYASGVTAIAGFSLTNLRLTSSVTRTGTTPFIQFDPFIRKSYFQNVQADSWNSFMWLKQFETVIIEGVFADQMTAPPSTTFGIQLGTQSASNTGAAAYIDKCQFRGGTTGSSVEANWSMGLLLNDVEGVSVSNSDFQKFDTNFVGDASTRLANLFFSNVYFDTTWIGPCFMMRGNGIKVEIQFKNGWVASAGQASGSPVTTSGAYGIYLKGNGSYGRIQFDTEYYNCAQNAVVITATSCDARFSGRVYSNATTTADNAIFSNTGLASAAPSLENLNISGGNSAACISYGANSTNYYISGVKVDQLVNLLGTPIYVDVVGATNARSIASATTLALPQSGGVYAITSTGTTFTSLPVSWIDRIVTLIFQSARTVVTGGNIIVAGGTFTTANQSTLTLRYDGASWYEMSRKA